MVKAIFLVSAVAMVAGCSPVFYETLPLTVDTEAGTVICQLYTTDLVVWDRSTSRPDTMDVATADAICVNEGWRAHNLPQEYVLSQE